MIEIRAFEQNQIGFIKETESALFSDPWGEKAIEELLFSAYEKALVLFWDSVPAGYLIYSEIAGEAEILRIGTANAFQKRGFASALMEALFAELKKSDCKRIFLEVRSQNRPAIALYEKMGFEPISVRRLYYKNPSDDALIYQRNLK